MKTEDQKALRLYAKAREDFQGLRKRMDNRLGRKSDGTKQKLHEDRTFTIEDYENFDKISKGAKLQEKEIEKMLKGVLKRFPIYTEWLKNIKGIAEVNAAWLLAEFDIEIAITVSKMWQYAGLNPGLIQGKKRMQKQDYKPESGEVVLEIKFSDRTDYIVQTNEMVRGDKQTPKFVLPYNKNLKTRLLGVIADGFIKAQNSYAMEFYYPYKNRLANSDKMTYETKKGGERIELKWKDCKLGHRDDAAKRYMIKMFLKDFYAAWREIEGLPVRPPYEEEYLGKKHNILVE
jgi:hypothetical protein